MSENTEVQGTPPANAPAVEQAPKKAVKAKKQEARQAAPEFVAFDTGKEDLKRLILAKDESDPYWDARQNLDVDDGVVASMAESEEPATIKVVKEGDDYRVWDGRNRVRAVPEANRLRKKAGKHPIVLTLAVVEATDDPGEIIKGSMRANIRVDSPPTVLAADISRALAADVDEEWLCRHLKMTAQKLHGMLALLDLPKSVQKHVDDATISITAALGLTKLDESKVEAAAAALAAAAKVGAKVTSKDIARVAGNEEKVASKKEIKQWALNMQSWKLAGKHGEQVRDALILAIEVCMGMRSIDQATAAADRLSKGEKVKLDFKQFQQD